MSSAPADQPGHLPLRPLAVGEILAHAWGVLRRHLWVLVLPSLVIALLGAAATWLTLSATGQLDAFLSGQWLDDALNGKASVPIGIFGATMAALLISVLGALVPSGIAAVCVAGDASGTPVTAAEWRERLGRRLPALLGLSLLVSVAVTIGLMLFIVPGVVLYLTWFVAAPALVMERGTIGAALRRSDRLTRGDKGRLLGVAAACLGVTVILSLMISSLVSSTTDGLAPVTRLLVSNGITAVVGALAGGWAAAATAVAYLDLRVRKENLAGDLRRASR